jgi:hypothetical protein
MAGPAPQIEWYLARDGQQFGPLSDPEMRKFVDLGHLRPTDLIWRQGFADWRPAPAVFPPRPAPQAAPMPRRPAPAFEPPRAAQPAANPRHHPEQQFGAPFRSEPAHPSLNEARGRTTSVAPADHPTLDDATGHEDGFEEMEQPRRKRGRKIVLALLFLAILGGAGWVFATQPQLATRVMSLVTSQEHSGAGTPQSASAPFQLTGGDTRQIDQSFQRTALWQLIKREFPDWYAQRVEEAAKLKSEQRDDEAISKHLAGAVVALRREHATEALAASPTALRRIATSFLDNLKHLQSTSIEACYGYISQGETSPHVLDLMTQPQHAQPLQRQVTSVFTAVAEGRKSPAAQLPPRKTDYEALTTALTARGWTDRDLQLFSNPRALAQATPNQVCRLVQDWFAAQLSITEEDVQMRLLGESLKPVVAG